VDALKKLTVTPSRVISFSSSVKNPGVPPHSALPPGSSFHYRPAQNDIKNIYAQCDVWLCGSRGEGFHLPPLEAMACRCPVVSTAVGGPSDIVQDGVNGYVVPIEDSTGLAEHLDRVLSLSDVAWRAMSDAAYATATRYTWDDATILFEQGLQEAIARRTRGEIA